jgi:hypothetical protein
MLHNHSSPVKTLPLHYHYQDSDVKSESGAPMYLPYPPDTKSFLYYFTPPGKPRIAAELRLRVTSSGVPTSFESGSDLLKSNGQPWSRPLCVLAKYYKPLYEKLREDRLVPDDLDAILSTFTSRFLKHNRSQLLYTLNDTFVVDFSCFELSIFVITEQGMKLLRFLTPFFESRGGFRTKPYTGALSLDTPRLMILMNL